MRKIKKGIKQSKSKQKKCPGLNKHFYFLFKMNTIILSRHFNNYTFSCFYFHFLITLR